jgi:hypothetical protein
MKQRLLLSLIACACISTHGLASDTTSAREIRNVISESFDKPGQKVSTDPVSVVSDFAIADWTQGESGGRALLRQSNGKWEVSACGGDGFKDVPTLMSAGVPKRTAERLVQELERSEKLLSPDQVKRFGLFNTANDPRVQDAKSHHKH